MEATLNVAKSVTAQVNGAENNCTTENTLVRPLCTDLTDQFCTSLWSSKNRGKMQVSDGIIDVGSSSKSTLAMSKIADLRALVASENRLAADMKEKGKPILDRLKAALDEEKDSRDWYVKISLLEFEWSLAIDEVETNRTEARNPELKAIKRAELSTEQNAIYQRDANAVASEILDAKYADDTNWLRAVRTFKTVKIDLEAEIRSMNLSAGRKDEFIKTLGSIEITLPYQDGSRLGASASCGATEINAFYTSMFKKFTVCAGLFNSFQSEASLYAVIAHEMAHAIDPLSVADRLRIAQSPIVKELSPLRGAKGPVFDCAKWKEKVAKITDPTSAKKNDKVATSKAKDPLQTLYDCLQPKATLTPITDEALANIAARNNKSYIGSHADADSFLKLAQPTVTKFGNVIKNEFYMRPDQFNAMLNQNQFLNIEEEASTAEVFVQSLACASDTIDGKETRYKDAPVGARKTIFRKAIEETSSIAKSNMRDIFNYCGNNCSVLAADNLSADSRENFADWIAGRASNRFLSRKKDLREARENSAAMWSLFCESPSAANDAPDLAEEQKKFSLESHPNNRVRRISLFTKANAATMKCEITKKDQGFGRCEL